MRTQRSVTRRKLAGAPLDLLHDLEAHERGAVRDRPAAVARRLRMAARERRALDPRAERLLALPAGVDEVAVLALDGAQQLEAEEAGHRLDLGGAARKALLELGPAAGRDLDRVDLDDHVYAAVTLSALRARLAALLFGAGSGASNSMATTTAGTSPAPLRMRFCDCSSISRTRASRAVIASDASRKPCSSSAAACRARYDSGRENPPWAAARLTTSETWPRLALVIASLTSSGISAHASAVIRGRAVAR